MRRGVVFLLIILFLICGCKNLGQQAGILPSFSADDGHCITCHDGYCPGVDYYFGGM